MRIERVKLFLDIIKTVLQLICLKVRGFGRENFYENLMNQKSKD